MIEFLVEPGTELTPIKNNEPIHSLNTQTDTHEETQNYTPPDNSSSPSSSIQDPESLEQAAYARKIHGTSAAAKKRTTDGRAKFNAFSERSIKHTRNCFASHLLRDERILGEFDVFYDRDAIFLSKKTQFWLTFFTLGLFYIFLMFYRMLKYIKTLVFFCEACARPVDYTEGKFFFL